MHRPVNSSKRSGQSGFSTIEVLIAIVVISIATLASYRALTQSARISQDLELRSYALLVAQNRAEEIKLMGVAAARALPETEVSGPVDWRITQTENLTQMGLIEVEIIVRTAQHPGARLVTYMPSEPTQ